MDSEAVRWCFSVAGRRIHGTTRQRPLEHFENEEKSSLRPLPRERWELATWQTAKIGMDCHASVARSFYSVPFKYAGRTLDARVTDQTVQFLMGGDLVKTHVRVGDPPKVGGGRRQTDLADLPAAYRPTRFARSPVTRTCFLTGAPPGRPRGTRSSGGSRRCTRPGC